MKNQDPVKNNARVINVPTLSESLVLKELVVFKKA